MNPLYLWAGNGQSRCENSSMRKDQRQGKYAEGVVKPFGSAIFVTLTAGLACLLLVSGCSHSITVEGRVPTPLIEALPLSIGVITQPSFNSYVHNEELPRGGGSWRIDVGQLNQRFFSTLFDAMFLTAVDAELEACRGSEAPVPSPDCPNGFVQVDLVEYAFLTPALSGLNFFSVSVKYQLTLFGADAQPLGDWIVTGYGKSESRAFQANKALNQASVEAIRDAGARLAIEWPKQAYVSEWIDQYILDRDGRPVM